MQRKLAPAEGDRSLAVAGCLWLRKAVFPAPQDLDGFDFSVVPTLNRERVLELV